VYEERLRVAQEVHDVVGHSLAMISLNAGVALHVLEKQQAPSPQVETALRAIRQAGTGALDELRGTLAVFTGQVAAPCPAPGLAALPRLVEATNVDGLSVTLDVAGEAGRVPPAVDAAGYRIVQEALTNVVRHAAAGNAAVKVTYRPRRVELRVTDDGEGSGVTGEGSGLAGMRGRARSVGGTLSAGPRDGGGFEVRTVLPHDPEPSE
jgi:signal transduction histidine kinase